MKNNITRIFASVISALLLGLSLFLASPMTAAAGCGGKCGGSGGIFSAVTTIHK